MTKNSFTRVIAIIIFLMLLLLGCRDQPSQVHSTVPKSIPPLATVARTPTATPKINTTNTPLEGLVTKPTALPTVNPAVYGQGEEFRIYVSYTLDDFSNDASSSSPPEGIRQIVIVATVENNSYESVEIGRDSLTLVGSENERFRADNANEQLQPSLADAQLEPGKRLLGLVSFTIPNEMLPRAIEWCPGNHMNCVEPLTAPIP